MKTKQLKDILLKAESLKSGEHFNIVTENEDGEIEHFFTRQTIIDSDYFIINLYGGVLPLIVAVEEIYSDSWKQYFWDYHVKKIEKHFKNWGKIIKIEYCA